MGDAEKPGSLPQAGSIYAILKIRSVNVSGPKEKKHSKWRFSGMQPEI